MSVPGCRRLTDESASERAHASWSRKGADSFTDATLEPPAAEMPPASEPRSKKVCSHIPRCPSVESPDHRAARVLVDHYEQGWSLLCNGVVLFTDNGELLPDGQAIARPASPHGIKVPAVTR